MRTILNNSASLYALAAFSAPDMPTEAPTTTVAPAPAAAPTVTAKAKRKLTSAKPSAKPATKRVTKAAAIEAAKADPRAARAERVAIDRKAVNALYASFEANRDSIPVKPLSAFKPVTTTAHPIARNPSLRQAAAIALAFSANGKQLKAGASASRVFDIAGVRSCIENGVLRDAVSSGLCTVTGDTPETEKLTISGKAVTGIIGLIGEKRARAGKLIAA